MSNPVSVVDSTAVTDARTHSMDADDEAGKHAPHLRRALELAATARARGDHPFGALLLDPETGAVVCEGMNSVLTQRDCTGHVRTYGRDA